MKDSSATQAPEAGTKGKPFRLADLSEDIWAVIIGGLLIAGVLVFTAAAPEFKLPVPAFKWSSQEELFAKVLHPDNLMLVAGIGLLFALLSWGSMRTSGASGTKVLTGFLMTYLLALCSLVIAGNQQVNSYGIEYVVFALLIGLLAGNTGPVAAWFAAAARSEFFIKTGLIILGTSVLFGDIVKAGAPGILQSVAVVLVVWFFSMWLSRKLKVDDEFGVMIASAVSICGVSAAIVASGAIQGDKRKLSYVTTLVLLVAIPMLILQPWLIRELQIPEIVGGAWLGGTLDTTASVTAASELVGPAATKAGVIVKFSQNVLIGVAAFFIAAWWALRQSPDAQAGAQKPGLGLIWERFPKFVLGFIAASLLFSFLIPAETIKQTGSFLNSLRTLWFALAFVAIGLEARFADLFKMQGGRPALVFVGAQLFNILWTLLWSFLLFGGYLMAAPAIE
ncbi:MAG: hypothetical protein RI973_429 [Bacteroidota bacterium]|jgi:uncharacterized integral membrane protein (TIGR00698 family)